MISIRLSIILIVACFLSGNSAASTDAWIKSPKLDEAIHALSECYENKSECLIALLEHSNIYPVIEELITKNETSVENVLVKINAQLRSNLFILDGDTSVRIDAENLLKLIKRSAHQLISVYIRPLDRFVAFSTEIAVLNQIRARESEVRDLLADYRIPVGCLSDALAIITEIVDQNLNSRPKRAVNFSPSEILSNTLRGILGTALKPIQKIVDGIFESVADNLSNFYTGVTPDKTLKNIIKTTVNVLIKTVEEVLITLRITVDGFFANLGVKQDAEEYSAKNRRDVSFDGDEVFEVYSAAKDSQTTLAPLPPNQVDKKKSFLAVIWGFVWKIFISTLSPLNPVLTALIENILKALYPSVGKLVLKPIEAILLKLLELIFH